jgi:hypothetical protein
MPAITPRRCARSASGSICGAVVAMPKRAASRIVCAACGVGGDRQPARPGADHAEIGHEVARHRRPAKRR